jgi:hypothetical protein
MTTDLTTAGILSAKQNSPLVVRSEVPVGLPYNDYREYLRSDFIYACAYCTLMEYEAGGRRFTIDHYVPRGHTETRTDDYENLMYACDECNMLKGNRYPPIEAREKGHRFYRPDGDIFDDHFTFSGMLVEGVTVTGVFTVDFLNLNRLSLRRLRDYRNRISATHSEASELIVELGQVKVDRLPKHLRARAVAAIRGAQAAAKDQALDLDAVLEDLAHSSLIDKDPDARDLARSRAQKLKGIKALYPGSWNVPRADRT